METLLSLSCQAAIQLLVHIPAITPFYLILSPLKSVALMSLQSSLTSGPPQTPGLGPIGPCGYGNISKPVVLGNQPVQAHAQPENIARDFYQHSTPNLTGSTPQCQSESEMRH